MIFNRRYKRRTDFHSNKIIFKTQFESLINLIATIICLFQALSVFTRRRRNDGGKMFIKAYSFPIVFIGCNSDRIKFLFLIVSNVECHSLFRLTTEQCIAISLALSLSLSLAKVFRILFFLCRSHFCSIENGATVEWLLSWDRLNSKLARTRNSSIPLMACTFDLSKIGIGYDWLRYCHCEIISTIRNPPYKCIGSSSTEDT